MEEKIKSPASWILTKVGLGFFIDICTALFTTLPTSIGFTAANGVLGYGAACWVQRDSQMRGIYFPADITMMWAWIGFPAYAYESRGIKGLLLLLLVFAAYLFYLYLNLALQYLSF